MEFNQRSAPMYGPHRRATSAIASGSSSAAHEAELARHFAAGASRRIRSNLGALGGGAKSHDKRIESIAAEIFAEGAFVAKHPVV